MASEMGKEGAKFIKDQFNWDLVAKNFLETIKPYVNAK